jgi:DNA gyrase subunit A
MDVRSMGRTASGVRGMRLKEGQKIISLIISTEGTVLNITENGYGKRTKLEEFTCHKRGGQGLIAIQTSERNGSVVGAVLVNDNDELMLITDGGTLVRTRVDGISVVGRNTQGVTIIRLDKKEKVIGVDRIEGLAGIDDESDDDESMVDVDSGLELDVDSDLETDADSEIETGDE